MGRASGLASGFQYWPSLSRPGPSLPGWHHLPSCPSWCQLHPEDGTDYASSDWWTGQTLVQPSWQIYRVLDLFPVDALTPLPSTVSFPDRFAKYPPSGGIAACEPTVRKQILDRLLLEWHQNAVQPPFFA